MQALARLRKAGFAPGISATGGLLIASASPLTDAQRTYIRAHKVLLLEELRDEMAPVAPAPPLSVEFDQDAFEERAAILEFEAGFSRDEAERRARAMQAPAPVEAEPVAPSPIARPEIVCCGDCAHSILPEDTEPVYGWRLCGLALEGGGGFGRADRWCEQWELRV